jgi:hypothetical protein
MATDQQGEEAMISIETLSAFLLFPMLQWASPANHLWLHQSEDYTVARYERIATDMATVVAEEEPLDLWDEPEDSRIAHTGILLLAIASYESGGYLESVDRGIKRGDSGRSHCLMQVMTRSGETPPKNRQDCFRKGLERVKESLKLCGGKDNSIRLAGYTSGKCDTGAASSQLRYNRAEQWWVNHQWFSESFDQDEWLDDQD